ncbi:hypothetical protein CRYUN_Cryun23aG0145400 [Craigia yunnanensis]
MSPLLSPRSSYQPQTVLTFYDDDDSEPSDQPPSNKKSSIQTRIPHQNHKHSRINNGNCQVSSPNPYEFLGSGGFSAPEPTTVDPFRNGTRFISGVYEVIKIVLCLPIALARLVLFGACLAIGYIATRIALEGWKDKKNSMPKWRSRIMWVTRVCARFILFSFGYQWIRRKGKPAPREIAPIVVSNHVIYVNRFSPASRKNSVNEIKLKSFYDICILACLALLFSNSLKGLISLAKLMFRMLTQFHNFMEVEYLPIIMPPDHKKQNAVHFAEKTGQAMASALNVVQTSHSYGDLMLLMKAAQLQQEKPWIYMVEMARIESLYHISSLEAVDFLDKFISVNPDTSGCVKLHDFFRVLQLKACTLSEEIFGFLDVEKNGSITFKQFLFGSAHVMKQPLFRPACELAFAECDAEGDNYCMEKELADIFRHAIPDLNGDEIHGQFNLFDTDNDGRISKDDFFSCLRKNPLLIALFSPLLLQKDLSKAGVRMPEEIL